MIHIIADKKENKGLINIQGDNLEVANDFANIINMIYQFSPKTYLLFLKVLEDQAHEIIKEEEAKKND